ncbi:hypothetical protein EVAR_83383_1 [Eumeta japonica]|uniref:Uncharacterized protein n=1 Tax=Eumeta variegata TaxID=151549 RepID=A0A4C1TYD6_EUMVA|nr:hypothetical protein EVAR_83383_1 [Eumeta japonica]
MPRQELTEEREKPFFLVWVHQKWITFDHLIKTPLAENTRTCRREFRLENVCSCATVRGVEGTRKKCMESAPRRQPALRFSFTVASEYGFLRCRQNDAHRFDVHTCLLQHELHKWRPGYNCDGCTNSAAIYRYRIRLRI